MNTGKIDGIPLVWIEPKGGAKSSALCIWLPGFSGTKESVEPQLRALADAGMTAVSFDPWQHGERLVEPQAGLQSRILSNIRRHFWPILANTAEESSRVIDWARDTLGIQIDRGVRMGGISMGGDISVAAAGLDPRIRRVAACVATPDWMRPGSHEPPGVPDTYAWLCFTRGNPMTNLPRYAHRPAITFQCGKNDTQVPPDGAQRFVAAMTSLQLAPAGTFDVTLHEGVGHQFTPEMWERSLAWLRASSGPL